MRRLLLAAGLLMALIGASPALADYAVVQFGDGYCRIWFDSVDNPWGAIWSKIAVGRPDHAAAQAALDNALTQRVCR